MTKIYKAISVLSDSNSSLQNPQSPSPIIKRKSQSSTRCLPGAIGNGVSNVTIRHSNLESMLSEAQHQPHLNQSSHLTHYADLHSSLSRSQEHIISAAPNTSHVLSSAIK